MNYQLDLYMLKLMYELKQIEPSESQKRASWLVWILRGLEILMYF